MCEIKAFKTLSEMLIDRNYIFNEDISELSQLKQGIVIQNNNTKLFLKYYDKKVKLTSIKNKINSFLKNDCDILLIFKNKINNNILKLKQEKKYVNCEFINLDKIQFNITKHHLVPKHIKLDNDKKNEIKYLFNIKSFDCFPVISKNDPVVLYYGWKVNDLIEIRRNSPVNPNAKYYRIVK